jgi:hypothetical protein
MAAGDHRQQFRHPGTRSTLPSRQSEGDVVGNGQMGEQRAFLSDVADMPLLRAKVQPRAGHPDPRDGDAARIGAIEAADEAEKRGLAAAGRSQDCDQPPRVHR